MRRRRVAVTLAALAWATGGCGGVGSVPSAAGRGQVKSLLISVGQFAGASEFTGVGATPDGTVYLGVVNVDVTTESNTRILAVRPGHRPRVVLRFDEHSFPGVDRIDSKVLTAGRGGELLVAGYGDDRIKVLAVDAKGRRRVIAGPDRGRSGEDLEEVEAMAADPRTGDVYVAERCRVYRLGADGRSEVVVGDPMGGPCTFGGKDAPAQVVAPVTVRGLAFDPRSGALYIADGREQVQRLDPSGLVTVAGRPDLAGLGYRRAPGFSGDGGPAVAGRLDTPIGLAVDGATGDVYVADTKNRRVRVIRPSGGIDTAVGNGSVAAPFHGPAADSTVDAALLATDGAGHVYATTYSGDLPYQVRTHRLMMASARPGK